jgi:ATP-dependent DNA helicase 2 subunit 2
MNQNNGLDSVVEGLIAFLMLKLQAKLSEVCIILTGHSETRNDLGPDFPGVYVLNEFERTSVDMIRNLTHLSPSDTPSSDYVNSLIVAIDYFVKYTGNKNFGGGKSICFLTNGQSSIEGVEDLVSCCDQLQRLDVKLFFFSIGPMLRSNLNVLESVQKNYRYHLALHDNLSKFELIAELKSKAVAQVSKCRVDLQITEDMKIPVWCYVKNKRAELPSLKKKAKFVEVDSEGNADVQMERVFKTIGSELVEEVPLEDRVKGYKYGADYVPFTSLEEQQFKYLSEKCLTVLAFTPR